MSIRAAQEGHVQRARQVHIVDEQRLPGEQPWVFVALDPLTEVLGRHACAPPRWFPIRLSYGLTEVLTVSFRQLTGLLMQMSSGPSKSPDCSACARNCTDSSPPARID